MCTTYQVGTTVTLSLSHPYPTIVILENRLLRKKIKAVAITFVDVVFITRDSLMRLLENYPAERTEVRRHVTKMAFSRSLTYDARMRRLVESGNERTAVFARFSLGFRSVFCVHEPDLAAILPHPPLTDLVLMLQLSPRPHLRPNHPSKH